MPQDPKTVKTTETVETITRTEKNIVPEGSAPSLQTLPASDIVRTIAMLNGEVNPNKASTRYWFEYGTNPTMSESTLPQPLGNGSEKIPVSAQISGLDFASTYYFRVVAENQYGKTFGAQHSFQTMASEQNVVGASTPTPIPVRETQVVEETQKPSLLSNILAIIGLIILLVIIVWGLAHLASLSKSWFSSIFSKSAAGIQVIAPAAATSGDPFTISWKYTPSTKGSYAFLYQCKAGLQFETPAAANTMYKIPCGAAFTVGSTNNTLSVTPFLSGNTPTPVPLSIVFLPASTSTQGVQGSATVTINPATSTAASSQTQGQSTSSGSTQSTNNYNYSGQTSSQTGSSKTTPAKTTSTTYYKKPRTTGPADISVSIISQSVDPSGMASVTFDIGNIGGSRSGVYYFSAQLPVQGGYTYNSPPQSPLGPGDHVINTLHFTQALPGIFSVSLNAGDLNQSNNYASQYISGSYYPTYTPQPYPQPQPYVY